MHFFSSSATQLNANSGRSTSFSSLRDCLDEKGTSITHGFFGLDVLCEAALVVRNAWVKDGSLFERCSCFTRFGKQ